MYDRDPQALGRDQDKLRQLAVAKANIWTAGQAARLGTSTEEILAAISRAWLPEDIQAVDSKYRLEADPPSLAGVRFKVVPLAAE